VIASGARYRFGIGRMIMALLDLGAARWPPLSRLFTVATIRDWFYYRLRKPSGHRLRAIASPGQTVVVIGDALQPGKSKQAIASAFEAALLRESRS
jgi:hypothetical protein